MALSDKEIMKQRRAGNIVIEPFRSAQLNTSSYDLTLGEWYFRETLNPDEAASSPWGPVERAALVTAADGTKWRVITLDPGESILVHSQEFIGGRNVITTMLRAKSSMMRQLLALTLGAGWGDVGYINRWGVTITNLARQRPAILAVGMKFAQLIFFYTGEIIHHGYTARGRYQQETELVKIKKNWRPEMILPKK